MRAAPKALHCVFMPHLSAIGPECERGGRLAGDGDLGSETPSRKHARSKGESQLFTAVKSNYLAVVPEPHSIQTKNSCSKPHQQAG